MPERETRKTDHFYCRRRHRRRQRSASACSAWTTSRGLPARRERPWTSCGISHGREFLSEHTLLEKVCAFCYAADGRGTNKLNGPNPEQHRRQGRSSSLRSNHTLAIDTPCDTCVHKKGKLTSYGDKKKQVTSHTRIKNPFGSVCGRRRGEKVRENLITSGLKPPPPPWRSTATTDTESTRPDGEL
jgi:hypothetical protein